MTLEDDFFTTLDANYLSRLKRCRLTVYESPPVSNDHTDG